VPWMYSGMRVCVAVMVLAWMAALSCYDVRQRRLPNRLTLPGAGVILLTAGFAGRGLPALAGAAALAGMYLLVGGLAGCFGAGVWFLAALGAPLLTALAGLVGMPRGVRSVPHGPSMCLATAAAAGLAVLS